MSLESWLIFVFNDEIKIVNILIITEKIIIKIGRAKTAKSVLEQQNIQYFYKVERKSQIKWVFVQMAGFEEGPASLLHHQLMHSIGDKGHD